MAKAVDILSYWMPILRNIKEFREIAKAEEPELRLLLDAVEQFLKNMFIETANEDGIKHFENMLGITPKETDDLSTRRFTVLSKWNTKAIYTDYTLDEILSAFCGEGNFTVTKQYEEYTLKILTHLTVKDAFEIVADELKKIIPCNLLLELKNEVTEISKPALYIGCVVSTAIVYNIPEVKNIVVEIPLYSAVANTTGVTIRITE